MINALHQKERRKTEDASVSKYSAEVCTRKRTIRPIMSSLLGERHVNSNVQYGLEDFKREQGREMSELT